MQKVIKPTEASLADLPLTAINSVFSCLQQDLEFLEFLGLLCRLRSLGAVLRAAVDAYLPGAVSTTPLYLGPGGTLHPAADAARLPKAVRQGLPATLQRYWQYKVLQVGSRQEDGSATGLTAGQLTELAASHPDLLVLRANLITDNLDCEGFTEALQLFRQLRSAELVWCASDITSSSTFNADSHLWPVISDMPQLEELMCAAPLPRADLLPGQRAAMSVGVADCPRLRHISLGGSQVSTYSMPLGVTGRPEAYWAGPQDPEFGRGCPAMETLTMCCCDPQLLRHLEWPFHPDFQPTHWRFGVFGLVGSQQLPLHGANAADGTMALVHHHMSQQQGLQQLQLVVGPMGLGGNIQNERHHRLGSGEMVFVPSWAQTDDEPEDHQALYDAHAAAFAVDEAEEGEEEEEEEGEEQDDAVGDEGEEEQEGDEYEEEYEEEYEQRFGSEYGGEYGEEYEEEDEDEYDEEYEEAEEYEDAAEYEDATEDEAEGAGEEEEVGEVVVLYPGQS